MAFTVQGITFHRSVEGHESCPGMRNQGWLILRRKIKVQLSNQVKGRWIRRNGKDGREKKPNVPMSRVKRIYRARNSYIHLLTWSLYIS